MKGGLNCGRAEEEAKYRRRSSTWTGMWDLLIDDWCCVSSFHQKAVVMSPLGEGWPMGHCGGGSLQANQTNKISRHVISPAW